MTTAIATVSPAPASRSVTRLLLRDRRGTVSLVYLLLLLILALGAGVFAPYSPLDQNLMATLADPSPAHWLGTDDLGRDVLSRLIYGVRTSLYSCALATVLSFAIGVPVGLAAGFLGGLTDAVISRGIDARGAPTCDGNGFQLGPDQRPVAAAPRHRDELSAGCVCAVRGMQRTAV